MAEMVEFINWKAYRKISLKLFQSIWNQNYYMQKLLPEIELKHSLQESLFHLSVHRISMFL